MLCILSFFPKFGMMPNFPIRNIRHGRIILIIMLCHINNDGILIVGLLMIVRISQLNQIPIMITQIKQRRKQQSQKNITLEISPKIQIKLQLSRLMQSKFSTLNTEKKEENNSNSNFLEESLEQAPNDEFKKYGLSASPQPLIRRKIRMSSFQLYKEQQRSLKSSHKNKINEWKARFLSIRSDKEKRNSTINHINRTSSFSEGRNKNKQIQLSHLHDDVFRQGQDGSFRSTYMKTSEGKRKGVENSEYLKKLKSNIQFYSLSTIINNHQIAINGISPYIKALQPKQYQFNHHRNSQKSQGKYKSVVKYGKASKFRSKIQGRSEFQCRPWSGVKQQFGELNGYL